MSLWDSSKISTINIGVSPNDGSGDNIRNAFNKVDTNFANINSFLRSSDTINFTQVNVDNYFGAQYANVANMFVANATGTTSNFTGNSSANIIVANTALYSSTATYLTGNTYVSGNIIPSVDGIYNLGSPTRHFANLYVLQTVSTNQISQSTDAGILKIHANAFVGDQQDTGILGNITSDYNGSNTYAFFGHQYTTNNFIYKITPVDTTTGNNIVVGGVYGNVQFGSAFFSNATQSTGTTTGALIVSGGAGIGGNINAGGNLTVGGDNTVTGNVYANGALVLTTSTIGYYGTPLLGGIILGSTSFTSAGTATSPYTGAVVIGNASTTSGLGVAGNIYAGTGFYGNVYGNVLTATQPYITGLGTLGNLSVTYATSTGTLQATSVGATNMTVTGTINLTGATINGAAFSSIPATGNITAGTLAGGFVGNVYGNVLTAAQPYITSLGNLTGVTVNGTVSATSVVTTNSSSMNTLAVTNFSTGNAVISGGYISALTNAAITSTNITNELVTNFSTGNAVIRGGYISALTNAAITTTNITNELVTNFSTGNAVITGGYITGLANVAATTVTANTINAATIGNTGAALVGSATLSGLAVNNTTVGANVSITANANITLTANTNTVSGIYVTGNLLPTANSVYNIGSVSSWFNTFYGISSQAKYADLAERYAADADYGPGTVVVFGGDAEITVTTMHADARVAGAISTDPAYLMNAGEDGLPVALRGRIPVKVIGAVRKGDSLVTATTPGYATSVGTSTNFAQAVFAKSIETDLDPGEKTIIAVIL